MSNTEGDEGILPREMASFLAGQVSFSAGLAVAYPLDTIKVRMQTVASTSEGGMLSVANSLIKREGIRGLYNGLTSPLFGYGLAGAVAFSGNDWATRHLKRWRSGASTDEAARSTHLSFGDAFLCGSFAGLINTVPRTLVDRLKTVAQVQAVDTFAAARYIMQHQGPKGLFEGMAVTALREVPQFGVYFSTFAALMAAITPASGDRPPALHVAGVGALAGVIQWQPPVYCIDVVKSRLQGAPVGTYSGMRDCASKLYAEHGWRVFVRGLGPTIVRGLPLHATTFLTYETLMQGAATSGEDPDQQATCLNIHHAAAIGSVEQCKYFLDAEGVDVNSLNAYDESALYCASLCGHKNTVAFLLARGARAAQYTFDGERVVYAALTDDIRRLLKKGRGAESSRVQAPLHTHLARMMNDAQAGQEGGTHDITFLFFPSPDAVPPSLPVWVDASLRGADGLPAPTPYDTDATGHSAPPLHAHTLILQARIPAMTALLTGPWRGAPTIAVVGGPPQRAILSCTLSFAYTDSLQAPWSAMVPLRRLAARLGFRRLRHAVTAQLKKRRPKAVDSDVTRITAGVLLGDMPADGTAPAPTSRMTLTQRQARDLPSMCPHGQASNSFKQPPVGGDLADTPAPAPAPPQPHTRSAVPGSLEHDFAALAEGVLGGMGQRATCTVAVEGRELPAHLEMLHSRSPYFGALFSPSFAEGAAAGSGGGSMPSVDLAALSLPAATALLRFTYAGAGVVCVGTDGAPTHTFQPGHLAADIPPSPLTGAQLLEVLVAADQYLMTDLRALAASAAAAGVHLEYAVDFYRAADAFGLRSLAQRCAGVMARHLHSLALQPTFLELVQESAASIQGRQDTDSIPVLDEIASELWAVRATQALEREEVERAATHLAQAAKSDDAAIAAAATSLAQHPLHALSTAGGFTGPTAAIASRRALLGAVAATLGLGIVSQART